MSPAQPLEHASAKLVAIPSAGRALRVGMLALVFHAAALPAICAAESPDFGRAIYPILQRACLECHGPRRQEGGLRLDKRTNALAGGDSGPAWMRGDPERSELIRRVRLARGEPGVMPHRGDVLPVSEIELLERWIAAGAPWPEEFRPPLHWAYVPPRRPAISDPQAHPIDVLVRRALPVDWPNLSQRADPATLARRLSLDLVGLPPSPDRITHFVREASQDHAAAVNRYVTELLDSPHYGERWARPWLDAARYADSHGFQRDDLREVWPYRDWVIRAFNADMPFDQFTIEQLAGDLLPEATESQRIATGFNRNAPCNVEAGTDPEQNRINQVMDRVNTLGTVWLGTTLECCQCHDHKYDPFSQRDYYRLFAIFNQTAIEADRSNPRVPGSIKFLGPYLTLDDPERSRRREVLTREIAAQQADEAREAASATSNAKPMELHALTPAEFISREGSDFRILEDGSVLLLGDPPATDVYEITIRTSLAGILGFKLEALTHDSLPGKGPGRGDPERTNFVLQELAITAQRGAETGARPVALADAQADFSQAKWDVAGAIDGDPRSGWAIAPQFHRPHWALFRVADEPITGPVTLTFRLTQGFGNARTLGRFRISAITGHYPASPRVTAESTRRRAQLAQRQAELDSLTPVRTLVMQELARPRVTHLLQRGDFLTPGDRVEPGTPATLPSIDPSGPINRLALARWLTRPDQPLVARVTVNRIWAELFGEGLVATPEDFGIKGDRPRQSELLDWLAVEFRECGWSQKKLLRTIVTSDVYQQSSQITPGLGERDPQNRWLARGGRFRLPAEAIRDNMLAVAGLLNPKSFGPPIRPPQPPGLWEKVGGEKYDYVVSPGDEQYRRGIYVVLKRRSPYPSFISFDGTPRLACRVKRARSNTPLQALVLLNDPVSLDAARALSERMRRDQPGGSLAEQLNWGFRLATGRSPREVELAILTRLFDDERQATDEASAWFVVASALLNLDETLTRN